MKLISNSPEETFDIGYNYASKLKPGDIVGLYGDLGSGKTQFTKGVVSYFARNEYINSPTFIVVNEYNGINHSTQKALTIFHFDLYRIISAKELEVLNFNDYINKTDSIIIIEWPQIAEELINTEFHKVYLNLGDFENIRHITY